MIRPKIEDKEDKNGKYVRFHLIGLGRCSYDVTEQGEMDLNCDMSEDELREVRNAIEYHLHFNYKQNLELKEKDTES